MDHLPRIPASTLWWLCLLACLHRVCSLEVTKRHNNDNEMNVLRIPSALCQGESYPLGMESGDITDNQISASSSYNLQSVGPQNARLNREISGGAWCPSKQLNAANSGNEWIQVDLADLYVVTAIATQGRFGNGMGVEFAEEYWIEYSRDNGTTWNKWTGMNGDYKMTGNHDTYTPHKNILSHPLVGINLIRLVPFATYQRTTCLRFELYGCKHDHTLPVSYSMLDGFMASSLGDLRDLTYDGKHEFSGYLTGGLGQLTDGIKGDDNYKVNYGYEWVGWRADGEDLSLVFRFDSIVNFTSATFYAHNLFSQEIQVFSAAKVWFSYDGNVWSKRPIEFEYMPDMVLENARDVVIHLHQRAGMFVKFDLTFASKWILISEISFHTSSVENNFTISLEHLELPFDALLPISTAISRERGLFPQTTFLILFGVLFTLVCSTVLFLLRLHLRRKEKAGHIVVCMKDLATTPLYCEPKDFSSTSSTISNTVADPEYAVPDVALSNVISVGNGNTIRQPSSGHLNTNLNMFGAGFTRIFMGGHLKSKTPTDTSVASNIAKTNATLSVANISTSNVAYSTQKFQYLADPAKNTLGNVCSYNVTKANQTSTMPVNVISNPVSNALNAANTRQYYASTDLLPKSPKISGPNPAPNGNSIDQAANAKMTSNTIYNKRKFSGINDDLMTSNSCTLKMKYSSNVGGSNELIDDMKCIPEVSESDIEVIRKQFGYSRFGEVLLGKFSDYDSNQKVGGAGRAKADRYCYPPGNDLSPETETVNGDTAKRQDKAAYYNSTSANETLVLLKTLEKEKLRSDFLHEMKSKWFISAKSERVAKLIGYLSTPRNMAMVIECADCDLSHFLRNCDKKSIGIQALLHIGSEVAAGMKYLESLGYVHRDLSARNCIIYTSTLQVKITDIAAFITSNGHEYCNGVALRWAAPEALINGAYTTKSDVYSFGVTFWEILTYALVRPHHELDDEAFLQKMFTAYESYVNDVSNECSTNSIYYQATYSANNDTNELNDPAPGENYQTKAASGTARISYRLALPRPTTCPAEIYDLMLECWQLNEQVRPSFRDITQFLNARNNPNLSDQIYA